MTRSNKLTSCTPDCIVGRWGYTFASAAPRHQPGTRDSLLKVNHTNYCCFTYATIKTINCRQYFARCERLSFMLLLLSSSSSSPVHPPLRIRRRIRTWRRPDTAQNRITRPISISITNVPTTQRSLMDILLSVTTHNWVFGIRRRTCEDESWFGSYSQVIEGHCRVFKFRIIELNRQPTEDDFWKVVLWQ